MENLVSNKCYTAHIVDRSNGVADEQGLEGIKVVRTPRSFASLFNMGDFRAQVEEAYQLTRKQLVTHLQNHIRHQ